MAINRFNQPTQVAGYTPMSFQELAFAPVQMRQREDRMSEASAEMLAAKNNLQFHDKFSEEALAESKKIDEEFNALSDKILQGGATTEAVNEMHNLRNRYNKALSKTGTLGMASGLRDTINSQKEGYYKWAIQQGHSPKEIEANWEKELGRYQSQLPDSLSKLEGGLPDFSPTPAPAKVDLAKEAAKLKTLMGKITDAYQGAEPQTYTDPETGEKKVRIVDKMGKEITNGPNIEELKSLLEMDVMNEGSALRQYMDYVGMDVKDYMSRIDRLGGLMLEEGSVEQTDMSSGSGGSRSSSKKDDEEGGATLMTRPSASETVDHTKNITSIDNRMVRLLEMPSTSDNERELTGLRLARHKKTKTWNDFIDSKEYENQINEELANTRLPEWGINTVQEYEETINDPDKRREFMRSIGESIGSNNISSPSVQAMYEGAAKMVEDATRNVIGANEKNIRTESEVYITGLDPEDKKLREHLSSVITPDHIEGFAATGDVEVSNLDPNNMTYTEAKPGTEEYKRFMSNMMNGNVTFEVGGLASGSEMTQPELMLEATIDINGEKEKMEVSINLEENDFTRELLDENNHFYKSLDQKGKDIVAEIRDNVEYSGLPTFSQMDPAPEFFNKDRSKRIIDLSMKRNQELFPALPKNTNYENTTDMERLVMDSMFIKPEENAEFGVEVNDDSSYSAVKRTEGDSLWDYYTIGDYFDKTIMADFYKRSFQHNLSADYLDTEKGRTYLENKKLEGLQKYWDTATDLNDLPNSVAIYNGDKRFKDNIQELHRKMETWGVRSLSKLKGSQRAEALEIYNNIKDLKLQSKQRKMVL